MAKLTSPPTDRQRHRIRRRRLIAIVVPLALSALVAVGVAMASGDNGPSKADRAEAVSRYQKELFPLVEEWGRIEVQGMRPAISDLTADPATATEENPIVPPETVAGEARAWQTSLKDLRTKIAALDPPRALLPAERMFDRSIVRYIEAAVEFEKAADGPADQRRAGIERGIDAAKEGARLYNEASMALQRVRKSVGLPVTPDFPNHPAGDQVVE